MSRRAASEPALRVELTERQREVLRLVAEGYTNGEIAERLGISLDGAKWHVREILGKLGVDSREEAAEWWKHHDGARWRRAVPGLAWRWALGGAATLGVAGIVVAGAWAALGGGADPTPPPVATATSPAPSASPAPTVPAAIDPVQIAGFAAKGLAFIRGGDLWVAEGVGGKSPVREVQVTRGAKLSRPSWSYSGEWILAQALDGAPWLFNASGKATPLTGLTGVAWAPDRDEFAGALGDAIVIGRAEEPANLRTLTHPQEGERDAIPAWKADGSQIAFIRLQGPTGQRIADQVWVIQRDGTKEVAIFADQKGGYDYLWGWAGNHVVFWYNASRSASIFADGATLLAVPVPGGPLIALGYTLGYADFVAAQPHGAGVLVVEGGGREASFGKRITFGALPGAPAPLADVPDGAASSPAWSPDGKRLAYVVGPEGHNASGGDAAKALLMGRRIWVQDAPSGAPRKLVDDARYRDEHPQWGGDGILFARFEAADQPTLWLSDGTPGDAPVEVTGVVSLPDPPEPSVSYYGHIAWEYVYDWWPAHGY